jgi:outer membrane protein assembly factor BamB
MGSQGEHGSERERRVDEAVAAYFQAREAGQPPAREEFLARYPDLADELASFLEARAVFTDRAGAPPTPMPAQQAPTLPQGEDPGEPILATVRYFGDYELLEEIARGGMGVVYKARQVSLNRVVALKMILAGQLAGEDDLRRFRQEAETAASLQHPNIVAIHEVGEHEGQHYFSMDYVEGRSLADLVRDHPLPPDQAVRYVRIIAEAVHFAHGKGVLHRDLKPSNVLIDAFDQPRVTDFGLAKRTDREARLTATGAVLGTPSYMPPEQASDQRGPLGPPSDVYALGSVLYELVTGRPPFRAATPMDTLLQVLQAEPASPRLLNPAISRDLETVLLKCLAKEPVQRYPSARELAEDLLAILEGRPVKARRPGLGERAARWFRKEQRSLSVAAKAVLLSLLLTAFAWLALSLLLDERQARLQLDTDGYPLRAEVLRPEREEVLTRFRVPHEDPVALPGGSYRVRVSAPGQLSQTFQLLLAANQQGTFLVNLPGRPRDELLKLNPHDTWDLVEFAGQPDRLLGRADLVLARGNRMSRLDGATRKPVWEVVYAQPGPDGAAVKPPTGPPQRLGLDTYVMRHRLRLVQPAPDLDGDGTRDLVWVGQPLPGKQPAGPAPQGPPLQAPGLEQPRPGMHSGGPRPYSDILWAISGKDGKELWWREAGGRVLGLPFMADGDGKGERNLVAIVEVSQDQQRGTQRWVEAFSGRTGKSRWRYPLDGRWYGPVSDGAQVWEVRRKEGPTVVCLSGTRLVGLDARTGKTGFEHDLGFRPVQAPLFVDLDRDGLPEALLIRQEPDRRQTLLAVTLPTGKLRWQYPLNMKCRVGLLVEDLDGDGLPEILVVNQETQLPRGDGPRPTEMAAAGTRGGPQIGPPPNALADPVPASGPWAARGVDVLDGVTGARRWRYQGEVSSVPLVLVGEGAAGKHQVLVGPDIRAEGARAVFVTVRRPVRVSRGNNAPPAPYESLVVALSGRDGRTLWRSSLPLPETEGLIVRANEDDPLEYGLQGWWPGGPHAWPLLLVLVQEHFPRGPSSSPSLVMLSAASGQTEHTLPQVDRVKLADLDGDGLPELCFRHQYDYQPPRWYALRGGCPVTWRYLGPVEPAADFDGDGVGDVLSTSTGVLAALSGRDGRLLWQSPWVPEGNPRPDPAFADLDGDGVPDVLVAGSYSGRNDVPLRALSGKDGRQLWGASHLAGTREDCFERGRLVACHDLDGDGRPEVVCVYEVGDRTGRVVPGPRFRLAVLRGDTGELRWQQSLMGRFGGGSRMAVVDLDGDGVRDLVTLATADDGTPELRAFSGRDGRPLWDHSFRAQGPQRVAPDFVYFAAGDLDGDGKADVVVALPTKGEVLILNGADGRVRATARGLAIDQFQNSWHTGVQPLTFAHRPDGTRAVCVSARRMDRGLAETRVTLRLTLLDGHGKTLKTVERPLRPSTLNDDRAARVWAGDLDGDGKDRLVVVTTGHVEALDGDGGSRWRWPLPAGLEAGHVAAILPRGKRHPASVVVWAGGSAYGLNGRTGEVGWRCEADSNLALLPGDDPRGWPRVLSTDPVSRATLCRLPRATDEAGTYLLPVGGESEPGSPPAREAPRHALPWADTRLGRAQVIVLLPYFVLLASCLLGGSWANLTRLLAGTALLGGVLGLVQLGLDTSLPRGESYAWSGWYWILLWAAGVVGWVVLPPLVLRALFQLAGWSARWVLWVVTPVLVLLLLAIVPFLAARSSVGDPGEPHGAYFLWALAVALVGGLLLPGPRLWRRLLSRRRPPTVTVAES